MEKWVELDFPGGLRIGIDGMAESCQWQIRSSGGVKKICLRERYLKTSPPLLQPIRLADASTVDNPSSLKPLRSWPPSDPMQSREHQDQARSLLDRRFDPTSPFSTLYGFQTAVAAASDAELECLVREWFGRVLQHYPHASLWALNIDPVIFHRLSAVRALFAAAETPEILSLSPSAFVGFQGGRGFSASLDTPSWMADLFLGWHSPWLTGVSSFRVGGLLVVLLGRPNLGLGSFHAELVRGLTSNYLADSSEPPPPQPQVDPGDLEQALQQWAALTSTFLRHILDPARFSDNGRYAVARHFGTLISVSRLIASILEIQSLVRRHEFSRKAMLFGALDIMEGLNIGSATDSLLLKRLDRAISQIREGLLSPLDRVLGGVLDLARKSVESLAKGFFLDERISGDILRVTRNDGPGTEDLKIERAAADFAHIVRNSHHSFRQSIANPRHRSLIANHEGTLPVDLPLVAQVYLLKLLLRPETIHNVSRRGSSA